MNHRQRKYLESIGVLIATLIAVSVLFEEHRRMAAVSFVPALIYIAFNWEALQSIPAVGPSPKEVLEHSSLVRGAFVGLLVIEIVIGYSFVITGGNVTEYVSGFGSLYLVLVAPVLPPIIVSQVLLFRRLGNDCPDIYGRPPKVKGVFYSFAAAMKRRSADIYPGSWWNLFWFRPSMRFGAPAA